MTGRRVGVLCLAIAVCSLWLRSGFPIFGIPEAVDDDGLFVAMAKHLEAGEWLGSFDARTLVKGMFYPLFISVAHSTGIPLKLAEQAAYLAAAWLVAWTLLSKAGRPWLALLGFAALALNPVFWTVPLARVIREGLYVGLSFAVVGLAVHALWSTTLRARLIWGALAGLVGGAYWLTREEGLWLVPAMLTVAGGAAVATLVRPRDAPTRVDLQPAGPLLLARLGIPGGAAAAAFLLTVGGVAAVNQSHYGVFMTNEVKSAPFRHAYGALARITPARWERYIVFPADSRARAYAVSPAARELSPFLDGALGAGWAAAGCVPPAVAPCREIRAGWFQWALRGAAAEAGHYRTAPEARDYYKQLAREVDAACDAGRLACGPRRATLAPPFRRHYVADAAAIAGPLAEQTLQMAPEAVGWWASLGPAEKRAAFADMVGPLVPAVGDPPQPAAQRRREAIARIARPIAFAYAAVMPVGALLGAVGVVLALLGWPGRRPDSALLLTWALAGAAAFVSRIALLSYLDVTAIPSANILYASPATPFAILFLVVGCWLGVEAATARNGRAGRR